MTTWINDWPDGQSGWQYELVTGKDRVWAVTGTLEGALALIKEEGATLTEGGRREVMEWIKAGRK